jgi:hypothetical protein
VEQPKLLSGFETCDACEKGIYQDWDVRKKTGVLLDWKGASWIRKETAF